MISRTPTRRLLALSLLLATGAARAQAPQPPSPESTDPVALQLMQGFPPPADKTVRLAGVLRFPNARWAYHHMRELAPAAQIWRGEARPWQLPAQPRALDTLAFEDDKGAHTTLADWQRATYTDGLLVLHKGRVVYEKTYSGMAPHQPHALWSMSKAFTGLLATMLIHDGTIDPAAPVARYLPELKDSAWGDATVQQTLDMTTAIDYKEDFRDPSSGIFQYLIAAGLVPAPAGYAGPRTLHEFLPTLKKAGEHGTGFHYKSVDTEVVGWLLQRATGKSLATLISERLWSRIGAQEDAYVHADPIGMQVASVGMGASLRDIGRVGQMLLAGGRAEGRAVVVPAAIADIRKGGDAQAFRAGGQTARFGYSYHNHWWIPHDADGSYEMKGVGGQHLHINPAAQLVIVKLSAQPGETTATHTLDRRAFAAIAGALRTR